MVSGLATIQSVTTAMVNNTAPGLLAGGHNRKDETTMSRTDQIDARLAEIDHQLYPDRPYPVNDDTNLGALMAERQALLAELALSSDGHMFDPTRPRPAGRRAQPKG